MTSSGNDIDAGLAGILISICILGVSLNVLVILVVSSSRNMRGSTDVFVVNLSVSDILLAGLALPLKVNTALYADGDFHGGDVACKFIQFIPQFSIMCSISTMVAISFDRLFSITRQKLMSTRTCVFVIVVIWAISLATSAPQLYEYSVGWIQEEYENETHLSCGSHGIPENFETVYASIVLVVSYVLPLVLIGGNYSRLIGYLYRRSRLTNGAATNQVSRSKIRVLKVLIVLTILFAVLWMPYFVLFTIEEITDTDNSSESGSAAHSAKHVMIALSTTTNAILYSLFNKTFRDGLRRLIPCCKMASVDAVGQPRGMTGRESGLHPYNNHSATITATTQS